MFCLLMMLLFAGSKTLLATNPPDEGMWMMSLIQMYNYERMHELGLQLTADQVYSTTQPCLKDAVVSFGGFCTAEFVSQQGLLFTNHHCGYEAIASLSSVGNNMLDNGWWSTKQSEEIPVPGLFVKVLVRMQDVTDSIAPQLVGLEPADRSKKVQGLIMAMVKNVKAGTNYDAEVRSVFSGNQYWLFVYQTFKDVRFVGAPPASIGKYGGDTDNWMWPRHTGDFSVFRVYAGKDNNPATYSADNVPYVPKKSLDISLTGFKEGDYTMTVGYPAQTNRYIPSFAVQDVISKSNPALIAVFETITQVQKKYMDMDEAFRLSIAGDYASNMNSLKLWQSETPGLIKENVVMQKQMEESAFTTWLSSQPDSVQKKYGTVLTDLQNAYATRSASEVPFYYANFNTQFVPMSVFVPGMQQVETWLTEKPAGYKDSIASMIGDAMKGFTFPKAMTEELLGKLMTQYAANISSTNRPEIMNAILTKYGTYDAFAKSMFATSVLCDSVRMKSFLTKPSLKVLQSDLLYQYLQQVSALRLKYQMGYASQFPVIAKFTRLYLTGLHMMNPKQIFYADANGTMRLSYGSVASYDPRDAVHYEYQTWLSGVIEKMDNSNPEFVVPDNLYQAWKNKDFGPYAVNGDVPVCFLTNNDIIGGNSGSPVLNGKGELIGLAFDGDLEGTTADYNFNPDLNRTICVDVRYVLFCIDKLGHAQNIMNELHIGN